MAKSCTRRRKRPNSWATGTMRSTIIVSRNCAGEPFHIFGNGAQLQIAGAAARELAQTRLGNDEFADAIHQLVQALSGDANISADFDCLASCCAGAAFATACVSVRTGAGDASAGSATAFTAAVNRRSVLDGFCRCANNLQAELHLVHDEDENIVDGRARWAVFRSTVHDR